MSPSDVTILLILLAYITVFIGLLASVRSKWTYWVVASLLVLYGGIGIWVNVHALL